MTNVIDSLKRLERAGSENSRTTEKLRLAADALADHIIHGALLPLESEIDIPDVGVDLPGAWVFAIAPRRLVAPGYPVMDRSYDMGSVGSESADRRSALLFAATIASGWLDELAAWLEQRNSESADAAATMLRVAEALR